MTLKRGTTKMTNSRETYRQMEAVKDEAQIRREDSENGVEQGSLVGVSQRSLEHTARREAAYAVRKAETETVADKYAAITERLDGRVPYLRIEGTVLQYSLSRFGASKMRHDLAVKSVEEVVTAMDETLTANGL